MNGVGGGLVNELRLLLMLLLNLMKGDFFSMNLSTCCGDGGGGCGGDVDAFIVSVRGIIHYGRQDCHSCVDSANVCYAFSPNP